MSTMPKGILRSAVDHVFRAASTVNLQTVEQRLADAQAALSATEAEYQAGALDAALSEDADALLDIEGRLTAARSRVESLQLAHGEASRRENVRLAEAKNAARRSQLNGLRQHVAAAAKEADRITAGLEQAVAAYRELTAIALKIERGLSNTERRFLYADGAIQIMIQRMVALELARIGSPRPNSLPPGNLDFPGASRIGHNLPHPQSVNDALPLADYVRQRFDIGAIAGGVQDVGSFAPINKPPVKVLEPVNKGVGVAAEQEPAAEQPAEGGLHLADVVEEVPFDAARDAPEETAMLAKLKAAHEASMAEGAEISSARLAQNWRDTEVARDGR